MKCSFTSHWRRSHNLQPSLNSRYFPLEPLTLFNSGVLQLKWIGVALCGVVTRRVHGLTSGPLSPPANTRSQAARPVARLHRHAVACRLSAQSQGGAGRGAAGKGRGGKGECRMLGDARGRKRRGRHVQDNQNGDRVSSDFDFIILLRSLVD